VRPEQPVTGSDEAAKMGMRVKGCPFQWVTGSEVGAGAGGIV
jgi:hypothetical protein